MLHCLLVAKKNQNKVYKRKVIGGWKSSNYYRAQAHMDERATYNREVGRFEPSGPDQ